jgi:hypothetical protein
MEMKIEIEFERKDLKWKLKANFVSKILAEIFQLLALCFFSF